MIKNLLLVGLGGALGSIARYGTALISQKYLSIILPFGTLIANILGSFLIGIFLAYELENPSLNFKLLLIAGFCGGYTTFSTFTFENLSYLQNGQFGMFLLYGIGSIIIGLLAVYFGFMVVKWN
ncbi:fluoride efflux transporter CrcB [Marivirga arenosa]|uniref:Fluoride-specific ion channel FluC n=1 Tax=Marivirga arenosa TaxID=3059076 RepID=A0AA51ZXR8_9BACT|nr:fluoride efflux transporter CrcB [Marivirga sp. BKB1-2]WNB18655.1 fluoride efflux transporter CrcB [Marivirga sp. BKB1-2]